MTAMTPSLTTTTERAIEAVDAPSIQRLAAALFRDDALRLAVVARPRALRGLERHLRLPGGGA